MCGIVGIFRATGLREEDRSAVGTSMASMHRRGPDGEGTYEHQNVRFGHKRLAILDPELGQQPWVDPASGVALTYNGEIFNYPHLRKELEAKGICFQTRCDTELLLKAYLEWGRDCVDRLDGMFAFAVHDPKEQRLWLVRDRFGIKPLYYSHDAEGAFIFASSVAGVLAFPGVKRVWDRAALSHYLMTVRTTMGKRTLVSGIHILEPGNALTLDLRSAKTQLRTYWSLPVLNPAEKDEGDLAEPLRASLRERFGTAVRSHLLSDVPLGGFLSGGLDSSILSGTVIAESDEALRAYSIGYEREGFNEWEFVREITRFHGIDCREIHLEETGYLDDWRSLIAFKGLPLSTPNEVPIMRLAQLFGSQFKVAMTGEGADEIFGGYIGPTFCAFDYDRSRGLHGGIAEEALQRAYGRTRFGSRREHFLSVNSWLPAAFQEAAFPALHDGADNLATVEHHYDHLLASFETCTTLDAYMHLHVRVNLEGLLNRLDSSTMAASVEGRVPYTDHHLAGWVFSLKDSLKMRPDPGLDAATLFKQSSFELQAAGMVESKRLLRAAFPDRVPKRILKRPKMSFPVPFQDWFNGHLKEDYQRSLHSSPLIKGFMSSDLRNQEMDSGSRVNGMMAWPLMNLALMEEAWGIVA